MDVGRAPGRGIGQQGGHLAHDRPLVGVAPFLFLGGVGFGPVGVDAELGQQFGVLDAVVAFGDGVADFGRAGQ